MKASFWHSCWERNSLGFHQTTIHPFLEQYFQLMMLPQDKNVFVPLCGKSDDMAWLAERLDVVGAELSDIACADFFKEKSLEVSPQYQGSFKCYTHKNLALWQGDFFKLSPQQFPSFDWIYDRAAIIALPVDMQVAYAAHLTRFISKKTKLFLISLEFPPDELEGPPFPLFENNIEHLFDGLVVECIAEHELEDKVFAQRTFNVSYLREKLYIISRK